MEVRDRTSEIMNIFKKLKELNLGITEFEEYKEFKQICNNFIRTGVPVKGKIKVRGTKRIISYNFNKKVDCILKYDPEV